jgi:type IV secretory pathway VirB2 component (pilin)
MVLSRRAFGLLSLTAVFLVSLPGVFAQAQPPSTTQDLNSLLTLLEGILATLQVAVYLVIGIGYMAGLLAWSAPTHSLMLKRGGRMQSEISMFSLFLALIGPGLFAFLMYVAQQIVGAS